MELDELRLKKEYFMEMSFKTLLYGKIFAVGSLIVIGIISFLEYNFYHLPSLLYCRLILILSSAVFLLLSCKVFKAKPNIIVPFHVLNLLCGILMMAGLAIVKSQSSYFNHSLKLSSITGGMVTMIFILFVFSSGARKYLSYIVLIPLMILIGYFSLGSNADWVDISFFINPLVAGIGASVFTFYQEKLQFQEFKMRKLAEVRKNLLEEEVKERKILEEKLKKQAAYDELTGVLNRRAGFELLRSKGSTGRLVLCYIDLDDLKKINDNYGHATGDAVIITLCNTIKPFIREDDFICRVGGDEFIVIFQNCTALEVELIIERIKQKLKEQTGEFEIDFSYGISEYEANKFSISQLIEQADNSMYKNKLKKKTI